MRINDFNQIVDCLNCLLLLETSFTDEEVLLHAANHALYAKCCRCRGQHGLTAMLFESQHVIIAIDASWRTDGVGRYLDAAFEGFDLQSVVSVDAILRGELPAGHVINNGGKSLQKIGDCAMRGIIANAVHDGHRAAHELGAPPSNSVARRDRVVVQRMEPFV